MKVGDVVKIVEPGHRDRNCRAIVLEASSDLVRVWVWYDHREHTLAPEGVEPTPPSTWWADHCAGGSFR